MARPNRPLRSAEERVWKDVARFLSAASRLLDEDLQRGANISLSEYAVLLHLSEAKAAHLRVSELAELADLSESRMTRLVEDLAKGGFVVKTRNQQDGRGIDVEPRALSCFGDVMAAIVNGIEESPQGH
jgi:DNA-binding MarR family transcriptional regulator